MCDQIVTLTNPVPRAGFPDKLRRIRFFDPQQERRLVFLTNNFTLPPLTVAQLYRSRWQVVVFQMDQTTPPHQKVLRLFRKCTQDPDLDRHLGLRAGGNCQKAVEARLQPLQNSTNLKRHPFRENPDYRGSLAIGLRNGATCSLQTTDSVPLTLGQ